MGSARPLPTKRDRWTLWNWPIRTKLFAVLMIPAIAAVVLGSLQVSAELSGVQNLGRIVTQVEVGVKVSDLVHELQRERELMAGFVATERKGERATLDVQKRRVDGLVTSLNVVGARLQGLDDLGRSSYQQATASVGALKTLRDVAETTKYSDQAVVTAYSAMIGSLLSLHREVTKATSNRDVGNIGGAADALSRAKEQVAQQHAVLLVSSLRNELTPSDVQLVRVADSRYGAALAEFFSVASSDIRRVYADTVTGPDVDMRERIKQGAVQAAVAGQKPGIDLAEWDKAAGQTADLMNKVEIGLNNQLRSTALQLRDRAGAAAVRDATILLGSLFATLLLVVVVARSMLVPLRTLRDTAFRVADRRLPDAIRRIRDAGEESPDVSIEPVAVHTREEIGQVARAFDAVHGEAVRLAAEQALLRRNVNDMFINLSRRSQGLVERQLHLIDGLENTEQDPEQLSNLFQLDHLATRMRRNSENLLVLAGAELQRRSTRPVPAVDVLRAAVSEVEEYQRVIVQTPPPVNVLGMAVNDIVHLVAELLDNATTFSPPDTRVVVRSLLTERGDLVVEIADQGVGMPYEQLIEANQRLAEPPTVDVSVSRRMGLFVVGRLAQRHGIAVRLGGNEGEPGLTAVVTVPADLIQAGEFTEYGPRTDQVPTPRAGTGEQPVQYDPTYDYGTVQLPQQPVWQNQPDEWPAAWPAGAEQAEPEPYLPAESTPMQVSMVDSMSGMDLFTPASVPDFGENGIDPAVGSGVNGGVDTSADRALREIFGDDYPAGYQERRVWPDTDQDAYYGYSAQAEPYALSGAPGHPVAVPPAERPAEDHLGVAGQVPRAEETTPIYEEMVSAWFRELTPPAPTVARPAPNYVEPPPFELPAEPSYGVARAASPEQHAQPAHRAEPVPASASAASGGGQLPRRSESRGSLPPPSRPEPAAPLAGGPPPRPEAGGTAGAPIGGRGRHAAPAGQPVAAHHEPEHEPAGNGDVWRSPADEGWQAAEALSTPDNNGFTAAGLPKRRRGAHLVPGAAAQPSSQAPTATPRRTRSADDVRGRLAAYQQGLRQGREFRRGIATAESPTQNGTSEESQ